MATWKRWLKYAKAKVDDVVRSADSELDEREAALRDRQAERPWLADDASAPSYDDVRRRIEGTPPHDPPPASSGDPAFDLAARQRAADERLAEIRKDLDLDPDA